MSSRPTSDGTGHESGEPTGATGEPVWERPGQADGAEPRPSGHGFPLDALRFHCLHYLLPLLERQRRQCLVLARLGARRSAGPVRLSSTLPLRPSATPPPSLGQLPPHRHGPGYGARHQSPEPRRTPDARSSAYPAAQLARGGADKPVSTNL